ncbi:MAG: hypothetical protein ABII09_01320 [Planctomycetota bacterium]
MAEENWVSIILKVISYILAFFAGGLTFTVFVVKSYKKKHDASITHQTGNIAGRDIAGRDIKNSSGV